MTELLSFVIENPRTGPADLRVVLDLPGQYALCLCGHSQYVVPRVISYSLCDLHMSVDPRTSSAEIWIMIARRAES